MKRFRSSRRQVQRLPSIGDHTDNRRFRPPPSQNTAAKLRSADLQAFTIWAEVTGVAMAAQSQRRRSSPDPPRLPSSIDNKLTAPVYLFSHGEHDLATRPTPFKQCET